MHLCQFHLCFWRNLWNLWTYNSGSDERGSISHETKRRAVVPLGNFPFKIPQLFRFILHASTSGFLDRTRMLAEVFYPVIRCYEAYNQGSTWCCRTILLASTSFADAQPTVRAKAVTLAAGFSILHLSQHGRTVDRIVISNKILFQRP